MWQFKTHLYAVFVSLALITTLIKIKSNSHDSEMNYDYNKSLNYEESWPANESRRKAFDVQKKQNKYKDFMRANKVEIARENNEKIIYFLGLFELSTAYGVRPEGISEVEAAQKAVADINKKAILPKYTFELLINDTECDPGVGIDRFFHALYSQKTITLLLGSGCSNVTESLANIVPYWNILQVSFGSKSPSLSDRNKFPFFFRTVAPDSSHNTAKASFIKYFKWNTVATFSQSENAFLLPLNNLVGILENSHVSCAPTITFSMDNFKEQLKTLKDLDIRIIVGSFSSVVAEKIFCEIYNLNMYGADYVWILHDLDIQWWNSSVICPRINLLRATEAVILISDYNLIPENQTSISGMRNEDFEMSVNSSSHVSKYARLTYDAVWAMALMLRDVQANDAYNMNEFYYDKNDFVEKFIQKMNALKFMGVSGPVSFNGADRMGNSLLKQIQGGELKTVAIFYAETNFLDFSCTNCRKIKWRDGRVPIAKRTLKIRLITIPKLAFILILIVSILSIIACLVFLYFNFHFRRMKVVKLSSPRLNNIAVLGCILVYAAVILLGINMETFLTAEYFSQLCTIRVYLLSAGFSLAFGSMFAKTYRVHRIFMYSCTSLVKAKILKDKQLILMVLLLLVIDGLIVVCWAYLDPLQRHLHNLTIEINEEDLGVIYQPQIEVCRCTNTSGWFVAMYGYKGFLLTMGVYMAWETRHIKVEALNDSQYIGVSVYSAVFSSIIVLLSNFLTEYTLLAYLAKSVSILIAATTTLCLLFLPKLKAVFWDNEQDPIMQSMGLKIECNTLRLAVDDPRELTYRMEVQNKVYKCEIEALDREIQRLERLLEPNMHPSSANNPIFTICEDPLAEASVSRASWPSTQMHLAYMPVAQAYHGFGSESMIHEFHNRKPAYMKLFDKLKMFNNVK